MPDLVNVPLRLRAGVEERRAAPPHISNTPDLPKIDWGAIGAAPPALKSTPPALPKADIVLITWAGAELAALDHVFRSSTSPTPYRTHYAGELSGWKRDTTGLPAIADKTWTNWGSYALVTFAGSNILLYKSNTHLDWPRPIQLPALVERLATAVEPSLILSLGTAGGTVVTDHIGTVRALRASTLYENTEPEASWPTSTSSWNPSWDPTSATGLINQLIPIPTTTADLATLCTQMNAEKGTSYTLEQLDPLDLNSGTAHPLVANETATTASLLTASTFVVGNTAGSLKDFGCIEMDDAVLGATCAARGITFGSVRNISDPAQAADLPPTIQGAWGSVVYRAYGVYTSLNGALVTAGILAS